MSKITYQKRTKTSLILYLYYLISKLKCQSWQSLYLWIFQRIAEVLLTYYLSVYGVPKIEKEVISFSIVSVSIILLSYKPSIQSKSLSLEYLMELLTIKPVLLQMELEKSISRVSHFLIVQLRGNFNFT